nr:uncharacterized protein LOC109155280 [Ipomoea batatas]
MSMIPLNSTVLLRFCDCAIHKGKFVLTGQRHRHCSSPGVVTSVAVGSLIGEEVIGTALPVIGFPDPTGFLAFPVIGFPDPAGFPVGLSIGVDLLLIGGQAAIEGDDAAMCHNHIVQTPILLSSGNFLQAKIGANPSYCWRSILAGQNILKQGCFRKIGNGYDTLIWKQSWLPAVSDSFIQTPCLPSNENMKVRALIDSHTKDWNTNIIHEIFDSRDVDLILKLPVAAHVEDMWCWKGDLRGIYKVKNGYRLLSNACLWRERNAVIFNQKTWQPLSIHMEVLRLVDDWLRLGAMPRSRSNMAQQIILVEVPCDMDAPTLSPNSPSSPPLVVALFVTALVVALFVTGDFSVDSPIYWLLLQRKNPCLLSW